VLARLTTASALLAALLGAAAPASANGPGGAPAGSPPAAKEPAAAQEPAATPAPATSGPAPRLKRIRCKTGCQGPTAASPGGVLDLRGKRIKRVEQVIFLGAAGDADDVFVAPQRVTKKRVLVAVPRFARTGPLSLVDRDGGQSAPSRAALDVGLAPADPASPGLDVEVQSPRVFFDGVRKASVTFALRDEHPEAVDVELVRAADGVVVQRWPQGVVDPGAARTVTWDADTGTEPTPPGRYEFHVSAHDPSGAQAASAPAPAAPATFELLDHQFPIRGRHQYGTGAASFGGGRGHQGHDVFASCGTPLVAARGGRVKFKRYHGAAGNYVVIDGEQTGIDYAYMHLRDAALVDEGDRVRTGQLIGYVGQTGRATGCHLHFEMWSAPGWYDGGAPFDPLPSLRAWDRRS
jgi:murein DD-endopeptidase MepM/ murein hydrolase activator NlpD